MAGAIPCRKLGRNPCGGRSTSRWIAHRWRTFDSSVDLQLIEFLREAVPDLRKPFATAGRVAALLACDEAGFCLRFGEDMRHEVVEESLDTRPGVSRHAEQSLVPRCVAPTGNRFHGMALRGCAGGAHPINSRMGWPWSMSRRLRPGISRRRESRPSWCKMVAWMSVT